jgi:hypothetical protein
MEYIFSYPENRDWNRFPIEFTVGCQISFTFETLSLRYYGKSCFSALTIKIRHFNTSDCYSTFIRQSRYHLQKNRPIPFPIKAIDVVGLFAYLPTYFSTHQFSSSIHANKFAVFLYAWGYLSTDQFCSSPVGRKKNLKSVLGFTHS